MSLHPSFPSHGVLVSFTSHVTSQSMWVLKRPPEVLNPTLGFRITRTNPTSWNFDSLKS